jgi:small ligand-binding sensory domain FIST
MAPFWAAHAAHPDPARALVLAAEQIDAQRAGRPGPEPTLGWLYLSDRHAAQAEVLLELAQQRWPGTSWVGAVGVGVAASGVEYFDEPALALMLGALERGRFRVFSGVAPLAADAPAHAAQVHADPATHDLAELIDELAGRTATGYLFGGLASSRTRSLHIADGVFEGGLSGVAFDRDVALVSRVTQGCQPIGPARRIDASERNLVARLDGAPALDCLLGDLGADIDDPRRALPALRQTLVGLTDARDDMLARGGQFGADTRVRHLIGIDPQRRAIAIGDLAEEGMQLAFCQRHAEAARRDLMRICAEIREELEPADAAAQPAIAGAIYVSCSGRGGPHFGAPSAELAIVRHALGDVPLVGFFAAGEIARRHLYGYTGVLTVFAAAESPRPSGDNRLR